MQGDVPQSEASALTPAQGSGSVFSGSCSCKKNFVPERDPVDNKLIKCRQAEDLYSLLFFLTFLSFLPRDTIVRTATVDGLCYLTKHCSDLDGTECKKAKGTEDIMTCQCVPGMKPGKKNIQFWAH